MNVVFMLKQYSYGLINKPNLMEKSFLNIKDNVDNDRFASVEYFKTKKHQNCFLFLLSNVLSKYHTMFHNIFNIIVLDFL